ncbi:MAG: Clp protease N-terminal domain-containing protein [Solirubrobacteraceae bacterium]
MFPIQRFSDAAKEALTLAQGTAARAHNSYIGTEHLLLSLLAQEDSVSGEVFRRLGIAVDEVRQAIGLVLDRNQQIVVRQIVPTSRVKEVIEMSFKEAQSRGDTYVGTEHILLGILREGEGIAAHILSEFAVSLDRVRAEISAVRGVEAIIERSTSPDAPQGSASWTGYAASGEAPIREPSPWAPPEHELGEPVRVDFLLARSATAAVQVQHLTAYQSGFEFKVVAQYRSSGPVRDPMHGLGGLRGMPGDRSGEVSDDHIRLRVHFADGSEADNLGPPMQQPATSDGPYLMPREGGASQWRAHTTFWVWPLPPPGPLTFSCEWPAYGIPLTRHEIDANLIREAAERATPLWTSD